MRGFQRGPHDMDVTDALERVVDAPPGHLDQHLLDRLVIVLGVDAVGRAELTCQLELRRVGVDRDDAACLGLTRALDRGETDAAQTEHGNRVTRLHLGGVVDRADAGGDTAAEQTDFIQRCLRIHFRQ